MYLHLHASKTFNTYKEEQLDKNKFQLYAPNFSRHRYIVRDEWDITLTNTQITFYNKQQPVFLKFCLDKFRG